jgi:hypothetical protein
MSGRRTRADANGETDPAGEGDSGMTRRIVAALCGAALIAALSVTAALGGEVTGTGKLLKVDDSKWGTGLHARSECAYSGQEDLQYFTDDSDTVAKDPITRGDPAHSQSWGRIPKADREFLTTIGLHPGVACNPMKSSGGEE